MTSKLRRLSLGIALVTVTTGAYLGSGIDAAFAAPTVTATVRTAGGPLNLRTGATSTSAVAGQAANGSHVVISCQVTGQNVTGTVRTSAQWDKLTSGTYVSHAYVQTSAGIVSCASLVPAASGPTVKTDGSPLNVRSGPSSQSSKLGTIADGAKVGLSCQVTGETVRGTVRSTAQWDKLTSGGYISHGYVQSSTSLASCAPPKPVTYDTTVNTEGGPLNVRNAPSAGATAVGTVADGGAITVTCGVNGDYISGAVRATSQWDRLTSGNYVSHAYVVLTTALPTCTGGSPVTGTTGPVGSQTNAQFIAAAVAPAQQSYREYKVPPSVTIAQSILESGWGRSGLAANDRNYFGIKCFSGSPGPIANGCHTYSTYECEPTCAPTYASFRTYASITDSFRDHGLFLTTNSRYRPAFSYTTNADQFLYQIWKAGYATSPTYVANVQSLMKQYNLYQYDNF